MARRIGFLVTGLGVLLLAWLALTIWQGDPITSLYTRYEQHALTARLATVERTWAKRNAPSKAGASLASAFSGRALKRKRAATAFARSLRDGAPIGRLVIPRIGLNMVVVEGTTTSDLERGPGHYDAASGAATNLPGMGGVIAIAGHRTTFLHPFRHIDDLKSGDRITLAMPYGTFRYTVYLHKIVSSTDWSILRRRRYEKLVLSACHPLYSATHRWIVFARLSSTMQPSLQ
jgi:sortase A